MRIFNRHTKELTFKDLLAQAPAHYVFNAQDDGEAIIDVFGEIDEWWGFGVRQMAFDLNRAQGKNLTIRIHSPGGLVTEGIGIRNLIRSFPGKTTTQTVGWAASIASVVLLAGDRVEMAENSFLMIHRPWTFMFGDADDARAQADLLDKVEGTIIDIYVAAILARKPDAKEAEVRDQVAEWVNNETWFTAAEALDAGFIDAVTDAVDFTTEDTAEEQLQQLDKFNNAPAQLRAQIRNKMSDKKTKGLLAQIRALLVDEVEEVQASTETEEETAATLEEALQILEAEGYTVTAPQEEETEEVEQEEAEQENIDEEAAEMLASLRDEVTQLRAEIKRRTGTPSGGGAGEKKTGRGKTERDKAYDAFVPAILKYARDNT